MRLSHVARSVGSISVSGGAAAAPARGITTILCSGTVQRNNAPSSSAKIFVQFSDARRTVEVYDEDAGSWAPPCNCTISYGSKVISWHVPVTAHIRDTEGPSPYPTVESGKRELERMAVEQASRLDNLGSKLVIDRQAGSFEGSQIFFDDKENQFVVENVSMKCKIATPPVAKAKKF